MNKKPEFEQLKALWYKKLAESGFEDIEQDENNLKSWSSKFASKRSLASWKEKAAYYSMATRFLNDYLFANALERSIWEQHSRGISFREIAKALDKTPPIGKDRVGAVIKRLATDMKAMYAVDRAGVNE